MPNESKEPTVRLHTTVWPNVKRALKDFAKEKWLSSADEALNRVVEFYSPTDSKELANHILFDCICALEYLPDPDDRTAFFRFLYDQFDGILTRSEEREAERSRDEETAQSGGDAPPEPQSDYREHPFGKGKDLHLLMDRKPFSVELTRRNFQTLKASADAMEMSVGELIDILVLGYPDYEDPTEQGLGVMTYFCVGMSRMPNGGYLDSLRIVLDILGFLLDAEDGIYNPKDMERITDLLHTLQDSREAELVKLRKWKYDNSVIATFIGFFPDLFGPET